MSAKEPMRPVYALVPAAGRGDRLGAGVPKQFLEVAGRAILTWTLERLLEAGLRQIVVALPSGTDPEGFAVVGSESRLAWVVGGSTRQASVAACLSRSAAGERDLVLVHDGVRPLIDPTDLSAAVAAAGVHGAAVLGRPVTDTLKRIEGDRVVETVNRTGLFRAETPQVFERRWLQEALDLAEKRGWSATDESGLVERLGRVRVAAVEAIHPNPKVTHPADIATLQEVLSRPVQVAARRGSV